MKRFLIFTIFIFTHLFVFSQSLYKSKTSSEVFILFPLSEDQAKTLLLGSIEDINPEELDIRRALRIPVDSSFKNHLPTGHYLITRIVHNQLEIEYYQKRNVNLYLLDNERDFQLVLANKKLIKVTNAEVRFMSGKKVKYSASNDCYFIPKSYNDGFLKVHYDGFSNFFKIRDRNRQNSLERAYVKSGLAYPINYALYYARRFQSIPYDAFESIKHGYPQGEISRIVNGSSRLFEKIACLFDSYYCDERFEDYTITNQPKYKPNDTIFFKTVIFRKKGRYFNEPVNVILKSGYYQDKYEKKITTLNPYKKGHYHGKIHLHDSLKLVLDKRYSLRFERESGELLSSQYFKLEQYTLENAQLDLVANKRSHLKGQPFNIIISGKDDNDLPLRKAKATIHLLSKDIRTKITRHVFVPDTLARYSVDLDDDGKYVLSINDESFPDLDFVYEAYAELTTLDNELLTKKINVNYHFNNTKPIFFHRQRNDSVDVFLLINKDTVETQISATAKDKHLNIAWTKKINLPGAICIDPYVNSYELKFENETHIIGPEMLTDNLVVYGERTSDSVNIEVGNANNLEFFYQIFKKNKIIQRGRSTDLQFKRRDKARSNYYISIQYIWNGKVECKNYQFGYQKNQLSIQSESVPEIVFPGQTDTLQLEVTDFKGRPVENADLLAMSLTSKFKSHKSKLYSFNEAKSRKAFNSFSTRKIAMEDAIGLYKFQEQISEFIDSTEYFKFLFPDTLSTWHVDVNDKQTQFAIYVFREGFPLKIHEVHVDYKPVFFSSADKVPFSFPTARGKHRIEIRSDNFRFIIDSVNFKAHMKTIISLNADYISANVHKIEKDDYPTKKEKNDLKVHLLPYNHQFKGYRTFIKQSNRYFPLKGDNRSTFDFNSGIIGPIDLKNFQFQVIDSLNIKVPFEPYYSYTFQSGLVKMKSFHFKDRSFNTPSIFDVYDEAYSYRSVRNDYKNALSIRRANKFFYANPSKTTSQFSTLIVHFDSLEFEEDPPSNCLLLNYDDATFSRLYAFPQTTFRQLVPGKYKLVFIYPSGLSSYDSLMVKPYGRSFYKITLPDSIIESEQARKIDSLILRKFVKRQGSTHGGYNMDVNEVAKTYRSSPQYIGPGRYISGVVRSKEDGYPIPGVNVIIKGTSIGTVTDMDGRYGLYIPNGLNTVLVFAFIGLTTEEIQVGFKEYVDVDLTADVKQLSEVVVVGYGERTVRALSGSVAAVQISGNSGNSIRIRGVSSIDASNPPLIIVDGVIYNGRMDGIDPESILEIETLKSENAIAVYGARAANGVIIISTKSGTVASELPDQNTLVNLYTASSSSSSLRRNFRDYAFWNPKLTTNKEGKVSFIVKYPDDITKWQNLFIATGKKKQIGSLRNQTKAFKPVASRLFVPEFLVKGDKLELKGQTVNYLPVEIEAEVSFKKGESSIYSVYKNIESSSEDSVLINTEQQDSLNLSYMMTTSNNYFDGEQRSVPVYLQGLSRDQGNIWQLQNDTSFVIKKWISDVPLNINLTSSVVGFIKKDLDRLLQYAHSCNEQTASKLIGFLAANKLNYKSDFYNHSHKIKRLVDKLLRNQNGNSLWSWFGKRNTNQTVTTHVIKSLLMAEKHGFDVQWDKSEIVKALLDLYDQSDSLSKLELLTVLVELDDSRVMAPYIVELQKDTILAESVLQLLLDQVKIKANLPPKFSWIAKLNEDLLGNVYFKVEDENYYQLIRDEYKYTLIAYGILSSQDVKYNGLKNRVKNWLLFNNQLSGALNTYERSLLILAFSQEFTSFDQNSKRKISIDQKEYEFEKDIAIEVQKDSFTIKYEGAPIVYLSATQAWQDTIPKQKLDPYELETTLLQKGTETDSLKPGIPIQYCLNLEVTKKSYYTMIELPIPASCLYQSKPNNFRNEVHREYFRDRVVIYCESLAPGNYQYTVDLIPRFSGKFTLNPAKVSMMYAPLIYSNTENKIVWVQ